METCLSCRRAGYFYVSERDFPAGFSSDLRRGFYDLTCNLDGLLLYRTWKIDTGASACGIGGQCLRAKAERSRRCR